MPYTDPHDFSVGELLTAATLDTHLRDNMRWVAGGSTLAANEGRGTTFPGSPVDNQPFLYEVTGGSVYWQFRYHTASGYWVFAGGPPLLNEVAASQSTTSEGYVDLGTAGPTVTVPLAGDYLVEMGASIRGGQYGGGSGGSYMTYAVNGAGASDTNSIHATLHVGSGGALDEAQASAMRRLAATFAASDVLAAKYRTGNTLKTATFARRWLSVIPKRVTA